MSQHSPKLQAIPIDKLQRGKYQSRQRFDQAQLATLATSIQATGGLLQPLVVRATPGNNYHEIIAGERRWRAAQLAGLSTVDCLVGTYSDEEALAACIIENINRVDLNPIEEAEHYQRMIDEWGYTHEEIAATIGKSRTKITNLLRLLTLDKRVKTLLIQGQITEGHGKVLSGLPPLAQYKVAQQCLDHGWSVRKTEQAAKLATDDPPTSASKDPNIQALENALSNHIGCKTSIDFHHGKGRLHIDFHNADILSGLLDKIGFQP